MDFLRGRLLRRSSAPWNKETSGVSRGASYSMETPSTPGRRGSSTSSWVKEGTTGTSSFWRDGTSASSWRDGSSGCPSYTPRSTYSKSEQSWRLPRWTRTTITFFYFSKQVVTVISCNYEIPNTDEVILDKVRNACIFHFRRDSYSYQSPTPTR